MGYCRDDCGEYGIIANRYNIKTAMFSLKHFSWKKWLLLTVFIFIITFLLQYFLHMSNETPAQLLKSTSLSRRLITALALGLFISFLNTDRQK